MGSDDLFKREKEMKEHRRRAFVRKQKERFLIVCEGEKTEPLYFEAFHIPTVDVKGLGYNTDSLVRKAIKLKETAKREGKPYNQVWCVFDKDDFPFGNYNNAFIIAAQNNINIAYTNEAFELWYLLHFYYYDAAHSRQRYNDMLTQLLGFEYYKNNPRMYDNIFDRQKEAIRNAKTLNSNNTINNPAKRLEHNNPSTTVHILVEELNKYIK